MFSLKLFLAASLLIGGSSRSFAEDSTIRIASAERKKVAPAKARKKLKAKVKKRRSKLAGAEALPEKAPKTNKKYESSPMFPPDDH